MKSLFPIILIIVAAGLFFFQINPLYSEVKLLRAESDQYNEALRTAKELEEIRSALSDKLESFPAADLGRLDHFLPRRLDTVRIILDLDGIAARNGVRIEGMTVAETSEKASSGVPGSSYSTIDVGFSFSATYPQGVLFIEDLQRSLRLIDVTGLTVRPSTKTAVSSVFYDFNLDLQTYWINR